jgi:hypothetical protein
MIKTTSLIYALCGLSILSASEVSGASHQRNYKYYFTWKNYTAYGPRERAVYVWNGRKVGVGKEGFRQILKRLYGVPDKSTVYVFPDVARSRYEENGPNPDEIFPFFFYWPDLRHAEHVKVLNLIFTDKDEHGRTVKGL